MKVDHRNLSENMWFDQGPISDDDAKIDRIRSVLGQKTLDIMDDRHAMFLRYFLDRATRHHGSPTPPFVWTGHHESHLDVVLDQGRKCTGCNLRSAEERNSTNG